MYLIQPFLLMYSSGELFSTLTCLKNTDLCYVRPLWPVWLHSCPLTVCPLPAGNWSLAGTNGCWIGIFFFPVCWGDNDKRPAWPCLGGSSLPPSERGQSTRLPLGSGVRQRLKKQPRSATAGKRSRESLPFPGCFAHSRLLKCPGLHKATRVNKD